MHLRWHLILLLVAVVLLAVAAWHDPPPEGRPSPMIKPPLMRTSPTVASRSRPLLSAGPAAALRASRRRLDPVQGGTLHWAALARCESSNNPRAVSPTGRYRGLVQFSLISWRFVGMTGDPIDYPASTQFEAARRLYARQGRSAWPYCGRWL